MLHVVAFSKRLGVLAVLVSLPPEPAHFWFLALIDLT